MKNFNNKVDCRHLWAVVWEPIHLWFLTHVQYTWKLWVLNNQSISCGTWCWAQSLTHARQVHISSELYPQPLKSLLDVNWYVCVYVHVCPLKDQRLLSSMFLSLHYILRQGFCLNLELDSMTRLASQPFLRSVCPSPQGDYGHGPPHPAFYVNSEGWTWVLMFAQQTLYQLSSLSSS